MTGYDEHINHTTVTVYNGHRAAEMTVLLYSFTFVENISMRIRRKKAVYHQLYELKANWT